MGLYKGFSVIVPLLLVCSCTMTTNANKTKQELNGRYLLDIGRKLEKPLLKFVGKAIMNLEKEITDSLLSRDAREQFFEQLCRLHLCTEWTGWTDCPANRGQYDVIVRTRMCGLNTPLCKNSTAQSVRTDTETKLCEGFCPDGYNMTKNRFCLKLYLNNEPRGVAESICGKEGGHLVHISSERKSRDVHLMLQNKGAGTQTIWIDGYRTEVSQPWLYHTPAAAGQMFTNWDPTEPSNQMGEICKVDGFTGGQRHWFDRTCFEKYFFVCEITA